MNKSNKSVERRRYTRHTLKDDDKYVISMMSKWFKLAIERSKRNINLIKGLNK